MKLPPVAPVTPRLRPEPPLPGRDRFARFAVPEGTFWARNRASDAAAAKLRLSAVDQGYISDCFFEATMGALALKQPTKLHDLMTWHHDRIDVTLPGRAPFAMSRALPLSHGEIIYSARGGNAVLWPAYLEKAAAMVMPEGYRSLDNGGQVADAFELLTGHRPRTVAAPEPGSLVADIRARLRDGHPVVVATRHAGEKSRTGRAMAHAGLYEDHAYVVEASPTINGKPMLRLWNIWGFDHPRILSESQVERLCDEVVTDDARYDISHERPHPVA